MLYVLLFVLMLIDFVDRDEEKNWGYFYEENGKLTKSGEKPDLCIYGKCYRLCLPLFIGEIKSCFASVEDMYDDW